MRRFLLAAFAAAAATPCLAASFPWLGEGSPAPGLEARWSPPPGYARLPLAVGSFGAWLRSLPLKPGRPPVRLFNGALKGNQDAHEAVIDIDVGDKDLQQCADAVMRLRAEYLYSVGRFNDIAFNYTNGERVPYARWRKGERPVVHLGRWLRWKKAHPDDSYLGLRQYLEQIYRYAGSYSLSKELKPIEAVGQIAPGDVFIQGGFPGHAVIVLDVAVHSRTGKKAFLLAQSYMPAQEMHVLRNPREPRNSPWYTIEEGERLITPEWPFPPASLRRF